MILPTDAPARTSSAPRTVRSRALGLLPLAGAALVALLVAPVPGTAQGIDALRAASERFAGIDAICADFRQSIEVTLLRRTRESSGRLCQQSPNRFAMTFTQPAGDAIVADGTYFWVSLPSENPGQVLRIPQASQPGGYDFYREFLQDPMTKYEVSEAGSETIDGTATRAVKLVPRRATDWREATLWIDPATSLVRKARIVETSGSIRTLTLSGIRVNPTLPAGTFEFQIPDGARVVQMGGAPRP